MTELTITALGTAASMPTTNRGLASTLITRDGKHFLFDCGEGTQRQMMKGPGLKAPTAIFITHYHPDHWLGLPGLLATLKMMEHEDPITIFGPKDGIGTIEMICQRSGGAPSFATFDGFEPRDKIAYGTEFEIKAFKTLHTPNSLGYVLKEYDRPGRFDVAKAQALGIKPGPDFKRLQNGESIMLPAPEAPGVSHGVVKPSDVMGPRRRGRKVAITGDTAPAASVADAIFGSDVLVHEATFTEDNWQRARQTKHSTARQAATIAKENEVGRLLLTHFSARTNTKDVAREAAEVFSPVEVLRDGQTVKIALPE